MSLKHCHFSILYNELPFLKQKLPFLYENFQQIIFYDLNVGKVPNHFSTDGSHEYISSYPDPERKITLIEKTDMSDIVDYRGAGSVGKQKMFAVGSSYVDDDVDVFWCTDMDEFFHKTLIEKVEKIITERTDVSSIDLRHMCFWKNFSYKLCFANSDIMTLYARICRHKPGNIYGHCTIQSQFSKTLFLEENDELYYHYGWVGDARVRRKLRHYTEPPTGNPIHKKMYDVYLDNVWEKFSPYDNEICGEELFGYPNMHPNFKGLRMGIKKVGANVNLPGYVDHDALLRDLENESAL